MPVKQVGKNWEVDGDIYNTEAAAENAYKAKIALRFGVEEEKPSKKSKKKSTKKPKKDEEVDESETTDEETEE